MTKAQLNDKLTNTLVLFSEEIKSKYNEFDQTPATKADVAEVARQAFYALNDFKNAIIEYLD